MFLEHYSDKLHFQESLDVKKDTLSYLENLEDDLNLQITNLGGNGSFSKIVSILSPSKIDTMSEQLHSPFLEMNKFPNH